MPKFTRTVGWGEALLLEVHFHSPGLSPLVAAITKAVGDQGVRNTYAKLYEMSEPPTLDQPRDYYRAWLVLTALGQDPADWQIGDELVPDGLDRDKVRDLVFRRSGWISDLAGCDW